MSLETKTVLVGAPDQSTTGAILSAPIGTALPTMCGATLDAKFTDSGYVSDDGLETNIDISTNDITEWGGNVIRKVPKSSDNSIDFTLLNFDYASLCQAFGSENVTKTAANTTHGTQCAVAIGSTLPTAKSWVFLMKDGDAAIMIVLPNAQVTKWGKLAFKASDAVGLNPTISCYPDSSGKSIYIYTDDGQKTSA